MKAVTLFLVVFIAVKGYSQSDTALYGYVDSATFKAAEIQPAPLGGLAAWDAFLKKEMRNEGTRGTVIVEFTVNKNDHAPTNIKIYRTDNSKLNSEAIRIIKKSRWVPAVTNGESVSYRMRQEIEFK